MLNLLPSDLRLRCDRIHAQGGPAPPPPGHMTYEDLTRQSLAEAKATHHQHPGGAGGGARSRSSRLKGEEIPDSIIFEDPEKIMRAKERKKSTGGQGRGGGGEPSQGVMEDQREEQEEKEEEGRVPETQLDDPPAFKAGQGEGQEKQPPPAPPAPPPPPRAADPTAQAAATRLIDELVKGTEGWLLDRLEGLSSKAAAGVKRFRKEPSRTSVVGWLREELLVQLQAD